MNNNNFDEDFKRIEYQAKIIQCESEIKLLNELISHMYYKKAVLQYDLERYKKILKTIDKQHENNDNIVEIVNKFIGNSDEDYVNLVKKVFSNSENIIYLTRCVRYLGVNDKINGIGIVGRGKKWYELSEEEIVKAAHMIYNRFLVQQTGPHKFIHCHNDGIIECNWYPPFAYCFCDKKCVYWNTNKINWFTDINLNSTKPVGKAMCRHSN
ncbi:hypothetical protein QJ854_gp427 [Moumouvirus goulette]|uniref:Uncharacterized protein n=1 Tax=Moumouvirus goulette TaxID=1247379 RepID=M1NMS8_9VIRU|nr:hypothetical protein QJ854_gp427 [Moumouvirus goulette]AGF85355.1 hypothetical protein glt_00546 [Moumouvirus goulette]